MKREHQEEIIKGCISGKRKAQEQLFKMFSDEMFGVCLYYSKDYTEAEDTLHEGFIKLVRELSPQYKMVFNLYAIDGYSHKEISEMLGISEGTSKSNLARARYILQEKVKQNFYTNSSYKDAR